MAGILASLIKKYCFHQQTKNTSAFSFNRKGNGVKLERKVSIDLRDLGGGYCPL